MEKMKAPGRMSRALARHHLLIRSVAFARWGRNICTAELGQCRAQLVELEEQFLTQMHESQTALAEAQDELHRLRQQLTETEAQVATFEAKVKKDSESMRGVTRPAAQAPAERARPGQQNHRTRR